MSTNVQEFGKFRYIEPNDVFENKTYGKKDGEGSYNVTQPIEDYSIAVELEVTIPNRGTWVTASTSNGDLNNGSSISFFEGVDGHLTNTPGTLIYKDLINGKQDKESLGITNIHIGYTSYYHPEVTIQFTDIRGMGLMMPHEESYRQESVNSTVRVEKFFAALFTFPYPEFKLRIKGFYGKKVEYSLVVSDFKSSFNNETGNFDATVKFIGKMYGVYTDIPFSYLLIAPYCRYGVNNEGKTLWQQKNFTFDDQKTMPTFLELREILYKCDKIYKDIMGGDLGSELESMINKKRKVDDVITFYNAFRNHMTGEKASLNKGVHICHEKNIFLFPHEVNEDESHNRYSYIYGENNSEVKTLTQNIYNAITEYNRLYSSDRKIPYMLPFKDSNGEIGRGNNKVIFKKIGGVLSDDVVWENEELKFDINQYSTIKSYVVNYNKDENAELIFYVINAHQLVNCCNTLVSDYDKKIKKELEKFNASSNNSLEQMLTFRPSIKNIYSMIMAHLQVFVELFSKCITDINNDSSRTIASFGINNSSFVDIPNYINKENTHVPPFPALKNADTNEICYPSDLNLKHSLPELDFINTLYTAYGSVAKEISYFSDEIDNISNYNDFFIPTCISDFSSFDIKNKNPYYHVFDDDKGTVKIDWILTFFGYRCVQKFLTEDNITGDSGGINADDFGAFEAYNFWLANPTLSQDIVESLTSGDASKSENFLNFLLGKYTYNNGKYPCYTISNGTENQYKISKLMGKTSNSDYCVVSGVHFPARIGHGKTYFEQMKNDIKSAGHRFGFGKDREQSEMVQGDSLHNPQNIWTYISYGNKPYEYMREIPKQSLEMWNKDIELYDGIPGGRETHVELVSKYFKKPITDLYYFNNENSGWYSSNNNNPSFNVLYQKKGTNNNNVFYEIADDKGICDNYSFESPNIVGSDEINQDEVFLHSIHTIYQRPMFIQSLENDVTAEDFLLAIPHNLYRIAKELSNGKTIISIPYATKLFIGYLIDSIQQFGANDITKLNNWLTQISAKMGINNYVIDGNNNSLNQKFTKLIYIIVSYLTVDDYGRYNEEFLWDKLVDIIHYDASGNGILLAIEMMMTAIKQNAFKNDISGFVDEYKKWRDDEYVVADKNSGKINSFKWLKKHLTLREYNTDGKYEVNIENSVIKLTGNNPYSRLCELLKNEKIKEMLYKLNGGESSVQSFKSSKNPLNKYYKFEGDIGYESETPFSEIYSGIYFNSKKGYLYLRFNHENEAVKELDRMFKTINYFIVPYNMGRSRALESRSAYGGSSSYISTLYTTDNFKFTTAFNSFINSLKELYANLIDKNKPTITENNVDYAVSSQDKLSTYLTFKNLYDKHFVNISSECQEKYNYKNRGDLGNKCEINRFHFIDSYYEDISHKFICNSGILLSVLDDIVKGYNNGKGEGVFSSEMSVYSFMSLLCQRHEMMLLSVPIFNEACNKQSGIDNLEAMFTPITYNDAENIAGPSYICFYPHKPSQHLDNPTSQYENDGFLITNDLNATSTFEGPTTIQNLRDSENNTYIIPSFGVEYGSQKQSIFKNINVNMDSPQVTEVSAVNLFNISHLANTDSNRIKFNGQDIYKIYSNYSYTCQVEMMGCAQVQPLMYFQLNNIPMFRGAYIIIQVDHDITPGDMKTTFKGVRINKNHIPMVSSFIKVDIEEFKQIISDKYTPSEPKLIYTDSLPMITVDYDIISTPYSWQKIEEDGLGEYITYKNDDVKKGFNRLNPYLRKLIYTILQSLPDLSTKLGYKIGIYVSRTLRETTGASDHCYQKNLNETPSNSLNSKRKEVSGYILDDNGEVLKNDNNEAQKYDFRYMGCAIDFLGTKDGNVDCSDASIQLFHHIAMNYYSNIRQLIWEMNSLTNSTLNEISNVIHLGTFHDNVNDTTNIFAAYHIKDSKDTPTLHGSDVPQKFIDIYKKVKAKAGNDVYTSSQITI